MTTVQDVADCLARLAPYELAESWDNCGLLVGDPGASVRRVLCALDATEEVLQEAVEQDAQVVVSHHPIIFPSVNRITANLPTGRAIQRAIRCSLSVICMHTNADCATGGVNDALAQELGLHDVTSMNAGENGMLGRIGNLNVPMAPDAFATHVKRALDAGGVRCVYGTHPIRRVAVGGGSCGDLMDDALREGADAFVIGDCNYHVMQRAAAMDLTLVDAGHFPTENPIVDVFATHIAASLPNLQVLHSRRHADCIHFV